MSLARSNGPNYCKRHIWAKPKTFFLGIVTLTLFTIAFFPALRLLFTIWMESEEYSHAVLTVPIMFYMVWLKRDALVSETRKYAFHGLVLAVISILFYLFAIFTQVRTLIFLSMYLTLIGSLVYIAGAGAIRTLSTPLFLLLMLIPIPEQLYPQLTFPLQLKVSQASEIVIKAFGIPLLREGNVMHIPEKSFEVIEACSGLRSVITLLTLSVIMSYFLLQRFFSKLILFAASLPIAIFVNIVRVVSMILIFHYFRIDLTHGALHTVIGLVTFTLALIIFFILQRFLSQWDKRTK